MLWGQLPSLLAKNHSVTTYARRGFPPNDGLGQPTSIRQHTMDLAAICSFISPKPVVVGWSYGGIIALDLAIQRPELLERLVVVEAPLHAKRHPTPSVLKGVVGGIVLSKIDPCKGARHFLTWVMGRNDGNESDIRHFDGETIACAAQGIVRDLGFGTGEKEITHRGLCQLSLPCAWLLGDRSIDAFASAAVRATTANPRIKLTRVSGSGHLMALDQPVAILDAVVDRD